MDSILSFFEAMHASAALVAAVVGIVTPLAVAVLQRPNFTKRTRTVIGVVAGIVVGVATAAAAGDLSNPADLLTFIIVVYTASEAAYHRIWKAAGLAEAIEVGTSPTPEVEENADEVDDLTFRS